LQEFQLRKELKEKFLRDLSPSEKLFFLKKAKEAVLKGYRASEDLFFFCYYLTLRERFRNITAERDEGMLRLLLVEGTKEVEEAVRLYEARLEKDKSISPDTISLKFIEYFSE
jgi:hypothetical protein